MVCSCTHIHSDHSFFQDVIDAPSNCFRFVKERIWSGKSENSAPISKKASHLKPETIIADIATAVANNFAPGDLDEKLKSLTEAALASGNTKCLSSCLDLLSKDQLLNATGATLEETALKIDILHSPHNSGNSVSIKTKLMRFFGYSLNFIPNLINTLLSAFRLFDTGKDPQTFWEISAALDILYKFVMIPAAVIFVVHLLFPGLGVAAYAITAVVVIALMAALTIYAKWLKPCPKQLAKFTNLTWEACLGNPSSVVGRNKEVDKIIATFISNKKCKHPMLVGPSGVGKNEVVSALAQRIAAGDVPDALKGKEIFAINSARLNDFGGFGETIDALLQRLEGHEDQVIFFFDEIHMAFKNENLRNYMKKFCDNFHCIGATTSDEFEKMHSDVAFGSRFEQVKTNPMEASQTKEVLYQLANNLPTPVRITENAYNEIINTGANADERSQPARAKALFLDKVGKKMLKLEESFVPKVLADLRADYSSLRSSYINSSTEERKKLITQLNSTKPELDAQENLLKERKIAVAEYKKVLSHYLLHRQSHSTLANTILTLQTQKKDKIADDEIKKFIFEHHYFLPQLESQLEALEKEIEGEFGFNPCLNKI